MSEQLESMGFRLMSLYIKVVDGQPDGHPVFEDNLLQIYNSIENIPIEYEPFERVHQNIFPEGYENVEHSYQKIEGIWKDVWIAVPMSQEEMNRVKQIKIESALEAIERAKNKTQIRIGESINPEHTILLQNYLQELNDWQLVDPVYPNFPIPPLLVD
jgi:hypothetical protein